MEDAYEVGIRLVLENGVSAGIAALQGDLAAYDRALAATTGRLRTVRDAGRDLKAPVGVRAAEPSARGAGTKEKKEAPEPALGTRPQVSVSAPVVALPAPGISAPAKTLPTTSVPVPTAPPPASVVAAPATPPLAAVAVPSVPCVRLAGQASGSPQGAQRPPSAPGHPVLAAAPAAQQRTAPPGRGQAMTAVTVTGVPAPRYARYAPASPTGQPPAVMAPEVAGSGPQPVPALAQSADRQAPFAGRDPSRTAAWNAAPPSAESATLAGPQAPPRPVSAPAAGVGSAAPVAAAAPSGPVQGDVYLDGARVGRWMSDRLGREADRPQGGVTGFDPRLGPAWPGSLHGT